LLDLDRRCKVFMDK